MYFLSSKNYVSDKTVRVVLSTLALMSRCVQTIKLCASVRERPRAGERERERERESNVRLCAFRT